MNKSQKQGKTKPSQKQSVKSQKPKQAWKAKGVRTGSMPRRGPGGTVGIASSFVANRSTYINRSAAPFHPKYGKGVAITGRQYLTSVITTGTDSQLFSGNSPNGINTIQVSPDTFNGRLALEARTYSRYRFTKLRLIYTPRVATTQAGEFVIGFYADGSATTYFTPSFTTVQESECSFVSSFHNGGQQLIFDIDVPQGAQDSYYCEYDGSSSASVRTSVQAIISGFPDVTSIGAITMGSLSIEYECILYCPSSDLGFTFLKTRIRSVEENVALEKFLLEYRAKHDGELLHNDEKVITQGLKRSPGFFG